MSIALVLLAGCTAYQPAIVDGRNIGNPNVGWNGYSLLVPEGLAIFNPAMANLESAQVSDFQRWYAEEDRRAASVWYAAFTERFLFEHGTDYFISFIADTYELGGGWASITPMEMQYALQQVARRKMVEINDDAAFNEITEINGHRAVHVSGTSRPYFKKNPLPLAYEGYFILGSLREAFWIEGFGNETFRADLKLKVREVVDGLTIH
ncbi:hypothetical protein PDESU_03029 [Pontiella desulfatans]|uniref:Uncharacterized protein n=1 Tax=Pontiella desulfatans TaxID=2750659 RepID=A0A6C2U3Q5_PONDE|nr:hypothetical protein [Pontiella desulfatans]VGO14467.1 hypothetical protein PDESU_03029 [Pontiella desulfatans]